MAFTSPAFAFLLIATVCCLMVTTAEEDVAVTPEIRESKQLGFPRQFYPASSQYYYPDSSPYGNTFGVPVEGVPNYQGARLTTYPFTYSPLDDPSSPSWRYVQTGGHDKVKWWKKNFHREATIIIAPNPAVPAAAPVDPPPLDAVIECSVVVPTAAQVTAGAVPRIVTDGLGPCKYATQAEQGTISITFSRINQAAFIAITADSQRNTRVKLTCTQIAGVALFTQTGLIAAVTDTPVTEIGFMQIIAVSTVAPVTGPPVVESQVRCNWHSYHHYTGTYP